MGANRNAWAEAPAVVTCSACRGSPPAPESKQSSYLIGVEPVAEETTEHRAHALVDHAVLDLDLELTHHGEHVEAEDTEVMLIVVRAEDLADGDGVESKRGGRR